MSDIVGSSDEGGLLPGGRRLETTNAPLGGRGRCNAVARREPGPVTAYEHPRIASVLCSTREEATYPW